MDAPDSNRFKLSLSEAVRWLLGIAVVALISFLYPNNLKFPYDFELGQTWRYPSLDAPYTFPLRKSADRLAADRQEVIDNLSTVYLVDKVAERSARQSFLNDYQKALDTIRSRGTFPGVRRSPEEHRRYGLQVMDKIFGYGILPASVQDDPAKVVTIATGNQLQERTIGSLFTPQEAENWLIDSLPYSRLSDPDFILPLLSDYLTPNLIRNDSLTEVVKTQALSMVSPYEGRVEEGQLIISQNSVITDEVFQKLVSYRQEYNDNLGKGSNFSMVLVGYAILTGLLILLLFLYLRHFYPLAYGRLQKLIFILIWPLIYALVIRAVETEGSLAAYFIPFCIAPIVIRIFFNERLAIFVHLIVVLIASFLTNLGYEFTFLQMLAGIVVVILDIDTRDWSRYFQSLIYLFGVYALAYIGLDLVREGKLSNIDWLTIGRLAVNVFLVLLAFPLIPLLERLFGFVSPITLTELSDMNRPLLRELAIKAPGTLQHSLNVANMCEQAARRIGADALLVKTAALYHDIGKTANPAYFIENQGGRNPHKDISEKESARIIIDHVTEGVKMAKRAGLPELLIQFIRTHHGDTRTEYFYRTYQKNHPEEVPADKDFRYPGPRPVSKEEAILMLADSTEAAVKSLKNPTAEEMEAFIDRIFATKVSGRQLEESKLTFRELEICRSTFRNILRSVHHLRIAYPEEE